MPSTEKARVFISYAHRDGAEVADRLHRDLSAGGFEVWLDRRRLSAGAGWSRDIEQAVDHCDVLVTLLSPGSFASDICRGEQLRALRTGKRVIPIMLTDSTDLPVFLEARHYISLSSPGSYSSGISELLDALGKPNGAVLQAEYRETYVTAPRLPPGFIARSAVLESLRVGVLRDDRTTLSIAALVGMGGAGKSTLAQMLCHDRVTRDAYPDGVIWIGLGQGIADLVPKLREVGRALGDEPKHYDTPEGASNRLRTVLSRKSALIVLDDVWELSQVQPFLAEAPASGVLITTRKQDISISLRARVVPVGMLSLSEAMELLSRWTDVPTDQLPGEAAHIIEACGRLPLAVSMTGGLIRKGLARGRSDVWSTVLHLLREAKLDRIRFPLENYPYAELHQAIQVSIDALDAERKARYLTMCVFPDDTSIPETTLSVFWKTSPDDAADTIDGWLDASLAHRGEQGEITLHDLQMDFVRQVSRDRLPSLHDQLLEAFHSTLRGMWSAGPNDGYYFQRLAWHMAAIGKWRDIATLLLDPEFIAARLDASSYVDLKQDLRWERECLAAIDDERDRARFVALAAAIREMSSYIARPTAMNVIDRWWNETESDCLVITGMAGTGKTSLMKDAWVRHSRDALLVKAAFGSAFHSDFAVVAIAPRAERDDDVWNDSSRVDHLVARIGARWVLLDALDELPLATNSTAALVSLLRRLVRAGVRVLASSRPGVHLDAIVELPRVRQWSLDRMDAQESLRFFDQLLGSQWTQWPRATIVKLVEFAQGSPLVLRLLADQIARGESPDDLTSLDKMLEKRARSLEQQIPLEHLRQLTVALSESVSIEWEPFAATVPERSTVLKALLDSNLFHLSKDASGKSLSASHMMVLEFFRARYGVSEA